MKKVPLGIGLAAIVGLAAVSVIANKMLSKFVDEIDWSDLSDVFAVDIGDEEE